MPNETKQPVFFFTARFCDATCQFPPSAELVDFARGLPADVMPGGVFDVASAWEKLDAKATPASFSAMLERLTREAAHHCGVALEPGKTFAAAVAATLKAHEKAEAKKAKAK